MAVAVETIKSTICQTRVQERQSQLISISPALKGICRATELSILTIGGKEARLKRMARSLQR